MNKVWMKIGIVQAVFVIGFGVAYICTSNADQVRLNSQLIGNIHTPNVEVPRTEPLRIPPLYDDPTVINDADLAAVLERIRPRFRFAELSPNFVEHALRVWTVDAKFDDQKMLSGSDMRDFLLDHAQFLEYWRETKNVEPLLVDRPQGIAIRWGRELGMSVHHDHTLACLTEAGVTLETPIFSPSQRNFTMKDLLLEALRDFRIDERETEWTAMAFGLWLAPQKQWYDAHGRIISFDLIAERLMRGQLDKGVCSGTHRVYSLMVLMRLDDDHALLSSKMRTEIDTHLQNVRDLIAASQFEDGHWPSNWHKGKKAIEEPKKDELKSKVIATGHHLEWLAIAPQKYHPPRDMVRKAARWCVENTVNKTNDEILDHYTFFSHVGNALAMWRSQQPHEFWQRHLQATDEDSNSDRSNK